MAKATWLQVNFNGGEWSPLAQSRVDLDKNRNGMDLCDNFLPTQQGGLTRRPGFLQVVGVKDQDHAPRLQRFEFSSTQVYMLEFGDGYVRIFKDRAPLNITSSPGWDNGEDYVVGDIVSYSYEGSIPLTKYYYCIADSTGDVPTDTDFWQVLDGDFLYLPTPYLYSELASLGFVQSADTLYITHAAHPPMKLQRFAATTWKITEVEFLDGPYGLLNTTSTTLTPSDTTGTVNVVASDIPGINGGVGFRASDVGRLLRIKCGGVWLWGTIATVTDEQHITWEIAPANGDQLPYTATATANVSAGSVFSVSITDGGSGYGTKPPSVSFSGGGGSGAIAYASLTNGVVTAVTVAATGTAYSSEPTVALTAPTAVVPSTTTFWRLGLWNDDDGWPAVVTFHQDRLCFAGAPEYPNRIDGSNTGDYENFAPTNVDGTVVDSNAVAFTLNSTTLNAIHWMLSDEWGLLAGTSGGEWVMAPSGNQQSITPSNVNIKQLSNFGSSTVPPVRVGKATLFVQRTGRKLRELFYQFTYNTFQALDISLVGEHLTKGGLASMAMQFAPQQILWVGRTDGALVALTYDKDQEIAGWHRHTLGGVSDANDAAPIVESVATIPATGIQRDEVWVAVKRWVNGAVYRSLEVSDKLWEDGDQVSTSVFLDSSVQYIGSPTSAMAGLGHLVGETVGVLVDGAVHPDRVVGPLGTISLQRPGSVVLAGLRYTSKGRTLKPEAGGADGPAQGKLQKINRVIFRFFQSMGLSLGSNSVGVDPYPLPFRTSEDLMDNPIGLFTGDKRWDYDGGWEEGSQVYFEFSDPLPCNIEMIASQLDTQDGR
jgi:hypothetical protein